MQNQHMLILDETQYAPRPKHIVLPPPAVPPLHTVFAEAMLEDTSTHQRRSPFDWIVSVGVHFAILAVLLILPLYFTSGLDMQKFNVTFLAAPQAPAAPPPPPMTSAAAPRAVRAVPTRPYIPGKLTAPSFIPRAVATGPAEAGPPEEVTMGVPGGVPGGIPGGIPGGQVGGVLGGVLKGLPPPAPAAPVAEGPKTPVQVGGRVKPPRLLFSAEPEYPVLAKMSHITGTVVIEAIIDEHGNVTGMRAISGPAILIQSAMTAVAKRKYEPTILDGEPTPIDLRVEVSFSLNMG